MLPIYSSIHGPSMSNTQKKPPCCKKIVLPRHVWVKKKMLKTKKMIKILPPSNVLRKPSYSISFDCPQKAELEFKEPSLQKPGSASNSLDSH